MKHIIKLFAAITVFAVLTSSSDAAFPQPQPMEIHRVGAYNISTHDTTLRFTRRQAVPVIIGLQTTAEFNSPKSHNWIFEVPEVSLPLSVEVNGKRQPLSWHYSNGQVTRNSASFIYRSKNLDLELVSTWEAADLPGPVEHKVVITNRGKNAVVITPSSTIGLLVEPLKNAKLESWWIEKGGGDVSNIGTHSESIGNKYLKELKSGPYSEDDETRDAIPWFCIHDSNGKHGIYGGIEFTGWTRTLVRRENDGAISISLGLDPDKGKTKTRINPGASFKYPTCFIGTYAGEVDDGSNRLHRWVESHLRPAVPGGVTPILVNNSWGSGMEVDEKLAKTMIDDCVEMGIELYHVDAGWFKDVGDWYSNPKKFPDGLEKVSDYAHAKGLKFGLWVGWTQGGAQKDSGPEVLSVFNPSQKQWFGNDHPEDWLNSAFTGATVCLGSAEARAWCLNDLRRMVKDYKLDLLEHDQCMVLDRCSRNGHGHIQNDRVDTSRAAANGYYQVYDQLRKENPSLLLEDCVNGGRMVDFGVVKRVHYICVTDHYNPVSNRRAFYDASYTLPPSMIELYLGDHRGNTLASFKSLLRSGMMGWCTVMMDMSVWSPEQREAAKREFAIYKEQLRPLIASANLYHILPRPDGNNWDGLQYADPKTGKGALMVFRAESDESEKTIKLKGLALKKRYTIQSTDGSTSQTSFTGEELMKKGLTVNIAEKNGSDIIFLSAE